MSSDLPSASVVSSSAKLYAVIISSNAKLHVVNKAAITTHQFIIFHYRIAPSRPTFGVFSCFNFYFCHAESFNRGWVSGVGPPNLLSYLEGTTRLSLGLGFVVLWCHALGCSARRI